MDKLNAHLILAEAAAFHPDRTYSLLRAGLEEFTGGEGEPIPCQVAVFLAFTIDGSDKAGERRFSLSCVSVATGETVLPTMDGAIELPPIASQANLVWNLMFMFPRPGFYEFIVKMEGSVIAKQRVKARTIDAREAANAGVPTPAIVQRNAEAV